MARHSIRVELAIFLLLIGLFFGCGGDDGTSPPVDPDPSLVSGDVDGDGGELVHDDVVLTVPGGALDETAQLAIHAEDGDHPLGQDGAPVYRITGLPEDLNEPVTLRFRHGQVVADGDELSCFLGEERQAHSGGSGLSWYAVAGRDSAGWAIVELERGALDLGNKDEGDVQATATAKWSWLVTDQGHFEVGFNPDKVSEERAAALLHQFDQVYGIFETWGFEFGDNEDIWPLDVNIRTPVVSTACYVAAPHGAGHFDIHPGYLLGDIETLPVVAHEVFHCVQTFYDPRPAEQWGVLNQERLWLDEATASYLETFTAESADAYPEGLFDDNYAALLAGIAGHPELENGPYGYGMSQFIAYLVEVANPASGEAFILELFEHFKVHGDVTDAIDAVITPSVATWCVDMHRKWALNEIYPEYSILWFWHQWVSAESLDAATGSSSDETIEVADLGANLARFTLQGSDPEPGTDLRVAARRADTSLPAEELPITVYGRATDSDLTQIATGTDELLVPGWSDLHAAYRDIFVMVSRPYSTAAGHTGIRDIDVSAAVMPDLSAIDVTTFDVATISAHTDVRFSNTSWVWFNHTVMIRANVAWSGGALRCVADADTFSIVVDPVTLSLGSWYGAEQYESIGGNWFSKRLAGHGGVPLNEWSETGVNYQISGPETCDFLTRMFESEASDDETPPYRYSLSWSCSDLVDVWGQSGIFIQLFQSAREEAQH